MFSARWARFRITVKGTPILEANIRDEVKAGIAIGTYAGFVPEYHVIIACNEANYRYYDEWQFLPWRTRALIVAHHFAKILIERHAQDAVNQESVKRANRARQARGKGR